MMSTYEPDSPKRFVNALKLNSERNIFLKIN